MTLLFITSGLLLGWSLGANDAANIFGSAVGSRMVSFRTAAMIASVSVIAGAVLQGSGTSETLGALGSVSALGGAFTVALAAAGTVFMMTRSAIPVSTTQAIVGAIVGWNIYTGNKTDLTTLTTIVSTWVSGPILGGIFAVVLYLLLKRFKRKAGIHLIRFESYIRAGLIVAAAFGAFSLGANNIANVMGVFVTAAPLPDIVVGSLTVSGAQQLFFIGGIAIAAGIVTYSAKVIETVGRNIFDLSSEAALVVVLSQSIVLFLFSSVALSNLMGNAGLPYLPLVPVSSSQVVIGSILGLGLYKGARNLNFKILGMVSIGWVLTPLVSGVITYISLFFVENVFVIDVV